LCDLTATCEDKVLKAPLSVSVWNHPEEVDMSNGVNYCPYCGERVDASVKYCPKCGTRIPAIEAPRSETIYQQPSPQQPAYQQQQPQWQTPYYQGPYTETRYRRDERNTAAFVLSLIGGIIILINGLLVAIGGAFIIWFFGTGILWIVLGLVFGFGTLVAALMLNSNPREHVTWGIMIIVFSVLSIVIGGGFIIGMILGLIGGVLALVSET